MRPSFGLLAFITFSLLLVGCGPQKAQPRLATFDPAEYAPYSTAGSGTIAGQAFLVTQAGDVKPAAGVPVYLRPATKYSTEWYERTVLNREVLEDPDPRAATYGREVVGDGQGNFSFTGLPAGEYYVASWITWMFGPSDWQRTGGWAYAKVKVEPGRETRAIVTQPRGGSK